jgi:chemotaxis signal transduction protein
VSVAIESASFEVDAARAAAILDARTAALAASVSRQDGERVEVLRLAAGGERYAIPLGALAGVLTPRPLGALPASRKEIAGTLHERGDIWIVHDLALLLGASQAKAAPGAILLLRRDRRRAALAVERVEGLDRPLHAEFSKTGSDAAQSMIEGTTPDGLMLIEREALWRHPALAQRKSA